MMNIDILVDKLESIMNSDTVSEIRQRRDLCEDFCRDLSDDFLKRGLVAVNLEKEKVQRLSQIEGFVGLLPLRKNA